MFSLYTKYLNNECSPEEVKQLLAHFNDPEHESELRRLITESLEKDDAVPMNGEWNKAVSETYQKIKNQIGAGMPGELRGVPMYKKTWFKVAASVAIVLSIAAFLFLQNGEGDKEEVVVKAEKKFENDIAPGGDKAILTLADGSKIVLDETNNGTIAQQGGAEVVKTADGQLAYTVNDEKAKEVLYNTVSTPRGGQYRLVLPDGSKVWLNAQSSIRFPNVFVGNERKVEITGEVYFEVTKLKSKRFVVGVFSSLTEEVKSVIEVLGTHFNVNSYSDEPAIKTTLLEGKVSVSSKVATASSGTRNALLAPGQQSQMNAQGEMKVSRDVDVEEVMAWKEGKFIFKDNDIRSVMRQLEKWYDIEVEFKGTITKEEFVGSISRNVNISQILNMLEKTRAVNFEIKGKKVIVK